MEPAERVTQALSVSQVTWKEHFSLEQMGQSESPTPLTPIKYHPWHHSHSLCRKTTSYPHLPTTMTSPFKEPLKLVKGGSAQQTPKLDTPLPAQHSRRQMQGKPGGPARKGVGAKATPHISWPSQAAAPSPWQPGAREKGARGREF